jgi:hypothetical protein
MLPSYLIVFGALIHPEHEPVVEQDLGYQLHLKTQNCTKDSYGLGVNLNRELTLC